MGRTFGLNAVDWEQRVDFDRLRAQRLTRAKAQLEASELGSLLCFDMSNVRYLTSTHIGTWAIDKLVRFAVLPQGGEPMLWDFGSAARHHDLYCPWLEGRTPAGISTLRGALSPATGQAQDVAAKVAGLLREHGLADQPVGVDVVEPVVWRALEAEGLTLIDGQQVMQQARVIKTEDEIVLLDTACMMADAAYEELYAQLRPGLSENECVGIVAKKLYDLGSEHVEGVNAISGERCNPHPHVYSDRILRPGDPAYFDITHAYLGYRTCYYRTFAVGYASPALVDAYKYCRELLDQAIAIVKPGVTTGEIASLWPRAEAFGFPNEEAAFALQYGHGIGLTVWEKPIISRLVSLDHPEPLEEGMSLALETFWPAKDGWSAARIEEQLIVTKTGCEIITRFPAEELPVAGRHYFTASGQVPGTRELQSHLNATPNGSGPQRLPVADHLA
ncbi:MAG TPA: Xaa-Pro peptidase family protein [Solirubrobacteraceae bacterium]|jgi:Xaa-Pro aminopeptidase|nr:Xaa-Pro peptidase family protein [Solirubrobacteraceae bacterium]